jgi:hypothetical protein
MARVIIETDAGERVKTFEGVTSLHQDSVQLRDEPFCCCVRIKEAIADAARRDRGGARRQPGRKHRGNPKQERRENSKHTLARDEE